MKNYEICKWAANIKKSKSQPKLPKRCTFCNGIADGSDDHVIQRCLNKGLDKEYKHEHKRAIKVPSCKVCNGRSDETLLKSYMTVFDTRFDEERIKHYKTNEGNKDLFNFLNLGISQESFHKYSIGEMSTDEIKEKFTRVYINEPLLDIFIKMFQGLWRHIQEKKLGKEWKFVSKNRFVLGQLHLDARSYVDDPSSIYIATQTSRKVIKMTGWSVYRLPLEVEGINKPLCFIKDEELRKVSYQWKYRDWKYGIGNNGKHDGVVLRYARQRLVERFGKIFINELFIVAIIM